MPSTFNKITGRMQLRGGLGAAPCDVMILSCITKFEEENLNGRDQLENAGVEWRIKLKYEIMREVWRGWIHRWALMNAAMNLPFYKRRRIA
jgi:hypothetical protein